jgi:hypothetical protein
VGFSGAFVSSLNEAPQNRQNRSSFSATLPHFGQVVNTASLRIALFGLSSHLRFLDDSLNDKGQKC